MYLPTIQSKDKSEQKRFLLGLCVPLVISLLYWPIVLLQAPSYSEGMIWLQNNPAISVFQVVLLPIISGILIAGIEPEHLRGLLKKNTILVVALLVIFLLMGLVQVVQDSSEALTDRVIEPLEFRNASDRELFAIQHAELRNRVKAKRRQRVTATDADICPELSTPAKPLDTASLCYKEFTLRRFGADNPVSLVSHAGIVSWWQRILSFQASILVMFLVWYLLSSAFARSRPPKPTFEAIVLCLAIAATWFPLRLYSEWFVNFGSLGTVTSYVTLFIVGAMLIISLGAAFFLNSTKPSVSIVAAVLAGLSGISGLIAKFSPETFGVGANVFERISPITFLFLEIILFLFLVALLRFRFDEKPAAYVVH